MLDDQQALDLLIMHHKQFHTEQHEIIYLIDLDYNLIFINKFAISIWNYCSIKNNLRIEAGINLLDYKIADYVFPDELKLYSSTVLRTQKRLSLLGINFMRKHEYIILIFEYEPIINQDTGNVIAIRIYAHKPRFPLNWFKIQLSNYRFNDQNYSDIKKPLMYDKLLTTREHEILFLLFHIDTYDGVAAFINANSQTKTSSSAVGKMIRRNLYRKFNVNDINSLKVKAIKLNYHKNIPPYIMPIMAINLESL